MIEQPNLFRQSARWLLTALLPRRVFLTKCNPQSGSVFITFDDGPHPEHTPRVLDTLAEAGASATFFVVGNEAEKYPELIKRMVAEGHSIGDHTWSHRDIRTLSHKVFVDELRRSSRLLHQLTGKPTRLFRPPYGKASPNQLIHLWTSGYTVALWNIDPRDYLCPTENDVLRKLDAFRMQAGDVVLLHDCMGHAPNSASWIIKKARRNLPQLSLKAL